MIDYESEAVKALNFKGHSPERRIMDALAMLYKGRPDLAPSRSPEAQLALTQLRNEGARMDVQIIRLQRENALEALKKIRTELELTYGGAGQMDPFILHLYWLSNVGAGIAII